MDRWQGLDAFVAVAETGSFTRAAARLGVSISSVSRDVRQLEGRLGLPLLVRTTRNVALTEAGHDFARRCRRLIEDRDAAIDAASEVKGAMAGHLRITCANAFGERTIVPIVNRFLLRHPAITADLLLTNDVLDLVGNGIDLAIRIGETADSRLDQVKLGTRSLHLVAAPAYLARRGMPGSIAALADHACLLGTARQWQFRDGGRTVPLRPKSGWHCNSGVAVLDAAMQGLGICQLPDFYVAPLLASQALIELLPDHRPPLQAIRAVFPARPHPQARLQALIDFIVGDLPGGDGA